MNKNVDAEQSRCYDPEEHGAIHGWMERRSNFDWAVICGTTLLVLVGLAYSNSLHVPFVFDDLSNIKRSNHVQILDEFNLRKLWRFWISRFRRGRPIAVFTFALNYCFGRYNPVGYHLVNMGVHVLAGLGVFFFSRCLLVQSSMLNRWDKDEAVSRMMTNLIAAGVALIWTLHPVQTQSVTYIVQRMTALAGLFYFWGLYFYLRRIVEKDNKKKWGYFILVFVCFVLGMGSKEVFVTFPLAVYLMDALLLPEHRTFGNRRWLHLTGLLVFTIAAGFFFLGGWNPLIKYLRLLISGEELSYRHWSLLERVMTEWRIVFRYIAIIAIPLPQMLNLLRNPEVSTGFLSPPTTVLSLVGILVLLYIAYRWRKEYPSISFAIFWFALHLLITSTLIPLELMFDHRLYLPLFGPVFVLVYQLVLRFRPVPAYAMGTIVVLSFVLAGSTFLRNRDWSSRVSLYRDVIEKTPENARGYNNLTAVYLEKARKHLENENFEQAREFLLKARTYSKKSLEFLRKRDQDLKEKYRKGRYQIELYMAEIKLYKGKVEQAYRMIKTAPLPPGMDPEKIPPEDPFMRAAFEKGNFRGSLRIAIRLLAFNPDHPKPYVQIARSLMELGKYQIALKALRPVTDQHSKNSSVQHVQGEIYRRLGNPDRAIQLLETALNLKPQNPKVRARIHESFAKYYDEAVRDPGKREKHARKALQLAPSFVDRKRLKQWVGSSGETQGSSGGEEVESSD